jgi:acetyltransferase-like isoleucine patch superfamily enzyme
MELGEHSYGSATFHQWTRNDKVKTGKFCSLAQNIQIFIGGNHRYDTFSTFPFRGRFGWDECELNYWGKSTPIIGNDVWIGNDVVAGQSVVTKNVPPYAIVA